MSTDIVPESTGGASAASETGLPAGYRQGVVTAATFLLGFALTFARFWSFDSGEWGKYDLLEGTPLVAGTGLLVYALFRALDPADDHLEHYRRTRVFLLWGILLVIVAIVVALLVPDPEA